MKTFLACTALAAAAALLLLSNRDSASPHMPTTSLSPSLQAELKPEASPELSTPAGVGDKSPHTVAALIDKVVEPIALTPEQVAVEAATDLNSQIDNTLDGLVEINRLLEKVLLIADLSLEGQVDFGFQEGEEGVAYKFSGLPDGVNAHILVGAPSFQRDGQEFHLLELVYQDITKGVDIHRGAARTGPRIRVGIDYGSDGKPGFFHATTQRSVSVRYSLDAGIDARTGEFTNGMMFQANVSDPMEMYTRTFGIRNGAYASDVSVPQLDSVIKPLAGDIHIDPKMAEQLLGKLQNHLSILKGATKRGL